VCSHYVVRSVKSQIFDQRAACTKVTQASCSGIHVLQDLKCGGGWAGGWVDEHGQVMMVRIPVCPIQSLTTDMLTPSATHDRYVAPLQNRSDQCLTTTHKQPTNRAHVEHNLAKGSIDFVMDLTFLHPASIRVTPTDHSLESILLNTHIPTHSPTHSLTTRLRARTYAAPRTHTCKAAHLCSQLLTIRQY
jgi:hypothetical protein